MATHPFISDIDCIVQEWALVEWIDIETNESQHMGRLDPVEDAAGAKLSLCIGRKDDELLIVFHLPIFLRATHSKPPKHMYVVLPVESLVMAVFYETISSVDIPERLRQELQKTGLQAGTTFLHINLRLDQPPGVVMPLPQQLKRPITGTPLQLLSSLKSLSESRMFNLFLRNDDVLGERLLRTCDMLQGRGYKTPEMDIGSRWIKDKWDAFPTKDGTLARPTENPVLGPPPYDENPATPVVNRHPPGTTPPANLKRKSWDASPSYAKPSRRRHSTPEQVPKHRDVGFQPQEPPQAVASPVEEVTGCASPELSATSVCFTDEADIDKSLPVQMMRTKATRMLFAKLAKDTLGSSLNVEQTKLVIDLTQWLYYAWELDPVAHRTFCADLGKLALAARTCNYRVFDILRIRCQQRLVLDSPIEKPAGPFDLPLTLKDKIKDLIDFLFTDVSRNADIVILDELVQLRHASLRVETARADKNMDESLAVEEEFSCRMAFCVVIAFLKTWGSAEL